MRPRMIVVAGPAGSGKSTAYGASLKNLPLALRTFEIVWAYDNSAPGGPLRLVLRSRGGSIQFVAPDPPAWLREALQGTEFDSDLLTSGFPT